MTWLLNKLFGWLRTRRPRVRCERARWKAGVAELRRRTGGEATESGAFLLGRDENGTKCILDFVFYDDVDPNALRFGLVEFDGTKFAKLWEICRARGYGVVADVHVHPGHYGQSRSDQENPVIPRKGHLAIIIPDFARADALPGTIGLYEHLGNSAWIDHSSKGSRFFRLD